MLREGLVEEFSNTEDAGPTGSGAGHRVLDGTTPGEFAAQGIRETNL